MQSWFSRAFPGRSPYRLFALSNLASMLALLGYPFLLEPWEPTRTQAWGWSIALRGVRRAVRGDGAEAGRRGRWSPSARTSAPTRRRAPRAVDRAAAAVGRCSPRPARSCCSRSPTTSPQNIAAVPLLWLAPLAIYLLTFILCFDGDRLVPARDLPRRCTAATLGVMAWTLADPGSTHDLALQLGVFLIGLFVACMFCHGELARAEARAALPHALLPDDLARRRASARRWWASSRRSCCARTSSSAIGPRAVRRAAARPCGRDGRWSIPILAVRRAGRDDRLRRLERARRSTRTPSRPRAISTACCACRRAARTT